MTVFMNEKDTFSEAFTKYADTVYRVAYHNTSDSTDAEDITQEVFLKLLKTPRPFKDSEHLKAWLIRVTINLCRDVARKKRFSLLSDVIIKDEDSDEENSVLEAVMSLPENYRNAIYLHYYEGYTAKETGKILGAKENTVLSWLSRGREALRKDLTGGFKDE